MGIRWEGSEAEISARARASIGNLPIQKILTDNQGLFSLPVSGPGAFRLYARAPGFGEQYFGSRAGFVLDKSTSGIELALTPPGKIIGRVIGSDGAALPGIDVSLTRESYDETGSKFLRLLAAASTDDRGEYRFADISPGRYYIRAHSRRDSLPNQGAPIPNRSAIEASRNIAPTFFPAALSAAAASSVEVVAGFETKGIDIVCQRGQTFSIRGMVLDGMTQAATPLPVVMYWLNRDSLVRSSISSAGYQRDGTFEFQGLSPGRYWVTAMLPNLAVNGAGGQTRHARASVEITTADVENVELAIAPVVPLSVRLTLEGGALADLKGYEDIHVYINGPIGENGSGMGLSPTAHPKLTPDGQFTFKEVVPDEYRIVASGLPENAYVKAARYGDADVLNNTFKVPGNGSEILEIVLSSKAAHLSGTLIGVDSKPLPFSEVVLLGSNLHRRVTTDAQGAFSIGKLPPGEYHVFGWSEESFGYFDPPVRSAIESTVAAIRVSESSSTTLRALSFRTK
jgi:hypothetical protein